MMSLPPYHIIYGIYISFQLLTQPCYFDDPLYHANYIYSAMVSDKYIYKYHYLYVIVKLTKLTSLIANDILTTIVLCTQPSLSKNKTPGLSPCGRQLVAHGLFERKNEVI